MSTYTIQSGDSLLQIAIDQQVEFTDLLTLNPQYQVNPNYIREGDVIKLPEQAKVEEPEPDFSMSPPNTCMEPNKSGEIMSKPECKGIEVHDVVFITGEAPTDYYCLSEEHQAKIKEEISYTDQLINGYKELLDNAPQGDDIDPKLIEQHALNKKAWLEGAVYAGAIKVEQQQSNSEATAQADKASPPTQQYIDSKISDLKKRLALVRIYVPYFSEQSAITVRDKVIESIDKEITYWEKLVNKAPAPESSSKQSIILNQFNPKTFERQPARRHVVEAWLASENRLVYIRADFYEKAKTSWKRNPEKTEATKALAARDWNGLKQAFIKDIKKGIQDDVEAAKLEAVFATWKAEGWKAHEWKATQKFYDEDGEVLFAATQQAQLLRFAAQASVKSVIEPSKGKIDLGIGAEASFALAEGSVELNRYLPYESGYAVELSYLDANKQPAVYPFGCFRANVSLMLSCFVGAMVNGRLKISNQPNSNPGHEVLLAPSINMGKTPSGGVGVNAEAFGGAQAGGQIEGGLEWKAPPDLELDKVFDFATLAKVGASGNVAIGAGAGWGFQLALSKNGEFVFNCSGRLVFGPGAGGGFGTTIGFEQLWQLAIILFKGLKATEYRILDNIDSRVYEYFMRSSYAAFAADFITAPKGALKVAMSETSISIERWWDSRLDDWDIDSKRQREAERIANKIVQGVTVTGSSVTGEIPFEELLPETVGMMLNTLVTTFLFSQEEQQETAIYFLFRGAVKTWRRFEEILVRMNNTGSKEPGDKIMFHNLARINAILDGGQQNSFNTWVLLLAKENEVDENNLAQMKPYSPRTGQAWKNKKAIVEKQIAQLNNNNGQRYV